MFSRRNQSVTSVGVIDLPGLGVLPSSVDVYVGKCQMVCVGFNGLFVCCCQIVHEKLRKRCMHLIEANLRP